MQQRFVVYFVFSLSFFSLDATSLSLFDRSLPLSVRIFSIVCPCRFCFKSNDWCATHIAQSNGFRTKYQSNWIRVRLRTYFFLLRLARRLLQKFGEHFVVWKINCRWRLITDSKKTKKRKTVLDFNSNHLETAAPMVLSSISNVRLRRHHQYRLIGIRSVTSISLWLWSICVCVSLLEWCTLVSVCLYFSWRRGDSCVSHNQSINGIILSLSPCCAVSVSESNRSRFDWLWCMRVKCNFPKFN